jgi:hypothetical protein
MFSQWIKAIENALVIEWRRFNIWLDARKENPRKGVTVIYNKKDDSFSVFLDSGWLPSDGEEYKRIAAERKAQWEHKTKLWTPEQHAVYRADSDRRLNEVLASIAAEKK